MSLLKIILAAAITSFSLLPALVAAAPDNRPWVIGQAVDLSGPNADFGRDFSLGAKLYFDHTNSAGGINGRRVIYRNRDSAGSPEMGLAAAQTLVKDGAQILFGVTGDRTVEAVARDAGLRAGGVPIFGAVAGNTRLGPNDGVYYLRAGIAQEIAAMVAHLAPLGIRSLSLVSTAEYYEEANKAANEAARQHGVQILAHYRLDISGNGPSLAAETIAQDKPQAVLVAADTLAVAQFFKRYRALDQGAFLCATSQVNVRTLSAALGTSAARGLVISQVVPDPASFSDLTRQHKKLMERMADEPASHATLEGFLAAKALVEVLRRNRDNPTAAGMQQALRRDGRVDLGGYDLDFSRSPRASSFVELTVVSRDGRLLR